MNLHFNRRKWWHFKNGKCFHIEISGWNCNPSIAFKVDGDEREVTFHFALGFGVWIVFERFFPKRWYPNYVSDNGYGILPCDKEISLRIHGGCIWWKFWLGEDEGWGKKTWRFHVFHVVDTVKGKHKYEKKEIERKEFILPFLEGNYNVEVTQNRRIDSYQHWFTNKSIAFEVRAGYYLDGKFIEQGIPVEGKGENSWDCDEDATYSMYFPGKPHRKEIKTSYDAALYFWHSMMKNRERRSSTKWLPERFKDVKLETIKKLDNAVQP